MNKKILATLGAATVALAMSGTASHALLGFEPGENSGLAAGSPLPEGVFAIDDELYGHRDGVSGNTGLNIPEIVWSTPYSFYNTRLEFVVAIPFFHNNGYQPGAPGQPSLNQLTDGRASLYNTAFGVILAHDFGNNFSASLDTNIHPPSEKYIPHTWADIRVGLSYTGNGFDLTAQFGYTGTFGSKNTGEVATGFYQTPFIGNQALPFFSDAVNVDLTATKKFGKFEIGFVGFAHTDIEDGFDNANATLTALTGRNFGTTGFTRAGAVAVGGLIGYDFGKFTVQADVTREVATRGAPQLLNGTGKETRGLFRLIVPLYVAPPAPAPVVARY